MKIEEIDDNIWNKSSAYISLIMEEDGGHTIPHISHIVRMDDRTIIGAFSLEMAPVVFIWMHTQRANKLQSYRLLKIIEKLHKEAGIDKMIIAIQKDSPFYPFINRLGFDLLGAGELHIKSI